MPRKVPPFDLDDAIRRYTGGEGAREIAATIGISRGTLDRRLRAAGVPKRRPADWHDEAVRLHLDGLGQREIGERLGRAQPSVSAVLLARGYRTDRSAAERRKWATMSAEQRHRQVAAAHDAVRGMTRSGDDLVKRAVTKQARKSHATDDERALAALLAARGEPPVLQQAVGKYNLDVGLPGVAVELFGGGWHAHGRHLARLPQRVVDIADAGLNLHITWTHPVHPLDVRAVADDVTSYCERTRSDPTFRRQYRVIWGDGQFIARGGVDDDDLTLIPTGIRGAYARRR